MFTHLTEEITFKHIIRGGKCMNWNQLQYVITIADEKNITKAAKKLFISQPSLSLSLQSLEKETGVTLFHRSHGQMTLTYAGTLFYDWAISALHSQGQLKRKLGDIINDNRRLISIGLSPHRSLIILPAILEQFYKDYPECEIHIIEKPTYILKKLLENNEIDFMVDIPHSDTINYQNELLTEERIVLAVPRRFCQEAVFSENKQGPISLSSLSPYPFIMLSSEQVLGSMSRKMCESAAFNPDIRLTCENVETALTLARQQLGITFVPEIYAKQKKFSPDVSYFPVQQFHNTRPLYLVFHRNSYQHLPLLHLLSLFKKMVREMYQ